MLQALSCLFISAKNYEMDPTVPSSRKFLRQLPHYEPSREEREYDRQIYNYQMTGRNPPKYSSKKNELCEWEQKILNAINFELDSYPVFYDIVEILLCQGLIFTSDYLQKKEKLDILPADRRSASMMEKYIDFFTLLSVQDIKLMNTNHYLIACSIVSASRKFCNVSPQWPQELV